MTAHIKQETCSNQEHLKRIANLCEQMADYDTPFSDNSGRSIYDYGKMCRIFADFGLNGMNSIGQKKLGILAKKMKDDAPIAAFYMDIVAMKAIRGRKGPKSCERIFVEETWLFDSTMAG